MHLLTCCDAETEATWLSLCNTGKRGSEISATLPLFCNHQKYQFLFFRMLVSCVYKVYTCE